MPSTITLVSHKLCPYVQRAAIVLSEKNLLYKRIDIDLTNKPDWFLQVSPFGKTPLLLVGDTPIFESAVICEYLDEIYLPQLHPTDNLSKAQHRGWMEFGSTILVTIGTLYNAKDKIALQNAASMIKTKFQKIEQVLDHPPYFDGEHFSMVDAAFAPIFRYFNVFDKINQLNFFDEMPKVTAWRESLQKRVSVRDAVSQDYEQLLTAFLARRGPEISRILKR